MKLKRVFSLLSALSIMLSSMTLSPLNAYGENEEAYLKLSDVNKETQVIENTEDEMPDYMNEQLSFEERAADLVSKMTLEEKASQIGHESAAIPRLNVSAYNYWKEGLHGVARQGKATSFPTSLAMSNTWNRELFLKMADITSTEARAKNSRLNLSYWSPTINMARDPRWGRNEETYGEDPYLTGQLGISFVNGMQGNDEKYLKTIATVKHFIANNCEAERRGGTSVIDERTFREYYAKVFQNVVEGANPASAMSSYNATTVIRNGKKLYDYIPSSANEYTLTQLLRRNWGFDGYVTGDCDAVADLNNKAAYKQALFPGEDINEIPQSATIAKSIKAGNDLDCRGPAQKYAAEAVENGYMLESDLDMAVYRLFLQRFRTGEFDELTPYSNISSSVIECQEHIDAAEAAAEETWVLLKNDNILPIKADSGYKNVIIVGNLAGEVFLGDYSGVPEENITPYEGVKSEITKTIDDANVECLGSVTDDTLIFNLKSITLVLEDGKTRKIDLTKALGVSGMEVSENGFINITKNGTAYIKNIDFSNVVSVNAEIAKGSMNGGSIKILYGNGGPEVAKIESIDTENESTYALCTAKYTGANGGYNQTSDMYIKFEANNGEFSVDEYKEKLDNADLIIAYGGTILSDSKESNDRKNISLPSSQSHVQALCDAYPNKTIVALSTVGQIDVSPFINKTKALLWTSYNGQTQGMALGKVLTGQVNPSGRLTTTWYNPQDLEKMPLNTTAKTGADGITRYENDYSIRHSDNFIGRTYQYYSGTPQYPFGYGLSYTDFEYSNMKISKSSADVNDTITVSVDVKNVGNADGKEVVQFYVAPPKADGINMPKKQLKGFEKVEIKANEEKPTTISVDINVKDLSFFEETSDNTEGKIYVPNGTYTIYAGKNAHDENNKVTLNVTGTLESSLKTVKAWPDGIQVNGVYTVLGGDTETVTSINPRLSIVMTDEKVYDISNADVVYTSKDKSIADIDENKMIIAGTKEGVTTITASVTIDGITKTESFPVVCKLTQKVTEELISAAKKELDDELASYTQGAYSEQNWSKLLYIIENAKSQMDSALDVIALNNYKSDALNEMRKVKADSLENRYKIKALDNVNITNGTIGYGENGIAVYTASETDITGTITSDNPFKIKLEAYDGNTKIDNSKLRWNVEKLDSSKRFPAEIDYTTGELTLKEHGLIRITAMNMEDLLCGEIDLYVNLQIEAELADDGDGANLSDTKTGASGALNGNNVGSSKSYWIEYKGVRLDNLKSISIRNSLKSGSVTANISLDKTTKSDKLIATGILNQTGAWNKWAETELKLNKDVLSSAQKDEFGLTTIYVQTNTANFDFIRLEYEPPYEGNLVYTLSNIQNENDGKISAQLNYRGTEQEDINGVFVATLYSANGKLLSTDIKNISGSEKFTVNNSFKEGDNVKFFVWNSVDKMKPISEVYKHEYKIPIENEVIVYSPTFSEYSNMFTGDGADGTYIQDVNGLSGYGTIKKRNGNISYEYNGKDYQFTSGWQQGTGAENKSSLFFTPKAPCTVTVVFNGNGTAGRNQYIVQDGVKLASGGSEDPNIAEISCRITDTKKPVYMYGGGSNKTVWAIIVEYDANVLNENADLQVQYANINSLNKDYSLNEIIVKEIELDGEKVRLTKNTLTGETKISKSVLGNVWTDISLDYFALSDIELTGNEKFVINDIAVLGENIYAACNDGIVLVITPCMKCYKLKSVCGFDIVNINVLNGYFVLSGNEDIISVPVSKIFPVSIDAAETISLLENGAILIDVRDSEDFYKNHSERSVNIPLSDISKIDQYAKDKVIVFCCQSGMKASEAVDKAYKMGFEKVYNAGSFENFKINY